MTVSSYALRLIDQEVLGLIHRLQMVKPFSIHETMVPAAMPRGQSLALIDTYLLQGRRRLLESAQKFRLWLKSRRALSARPESVYRRFVFLRLQATAALTQFDVFSDAITQRSEAETGVLLRGMDVLAEDALRLQAPPFEAPALLCYLDRGIGAAIRRARTRLPGGGENPVAIIRVPRERMVGLGIASSLVHEVGHQGAALLDLVPMLRKGMEPMLSAPAGEINPWLSWHRWISEIVADLWSVARVGLSSSLGLINVVSLPRPFVFRANTEDPHPTPWLRVLLSLEMGRQLYPHEEWHRLKALWVQMYPLNRQDVRDRDLILQLARHVPLFVRWMLRQRIAAAGQRSLRDVLYDPAIAPDALHEKLELWNRSHRFVDGLRPCQVFALVGYARLVRGRTPVPETRNLHRLLLRWALEPDAINRNERDPPVPARSLSSHRLVRNV